MEIVKKEKGFISLLVLLVLAVLFWKGSILFYKVGSQERMVVYESQKTRARILADSGLEWAKSALEADSSWTGGYKSMATGVLEVTVIPVPKGYSITCRTEAGRARHSLSAEFVCENGCLVLESYKELYN